MGNIVGIGINMGIVDIDDRGRITIPKDDRERLGLKPGQKLFIFVENGELRIKRSIPATNFIEELKGCIMTPDEKMDPLKVKEMWEKTS